MMGGLFCVESNIARYSSSICPVLAREGREGVRSCLAKIELKTLHVAEKERILELSSPTLIQRPPPHHVCMCRYACNLLWPKCSHLTVTQMFL